MEDKGKMNILLTTDHVYISLFATCGTTTWPSASNVNVEFAQSQFQAATFFSRSNYFYYHHYYLYTHFFILIAYNSHTGG
jgi:hypothetical protein